MKNTELTGIASAVRAKGFDIFPDTYSYVVFYPLLGSLKRLNREERRARFGRRRIRNISVGGGTPTCLGEGRPLCGRKTSTEVFRLI